MLSKESLKYLKLTLRIGERIYAQPLVWDDETGVVRVMGSNIWRWKVVAGIMGTYTVYSLARFIQAFMIQGKPLHECILVIYYCLSHVYFNTIQQNYHFRRQETAAFITKFLEFDRQSATPEKNGTQPDKVGNVFKAVVALGYGHSIFQGMGFLYFSDKQNFAYSAIMNLPGCGGLEVKLVFAAFEVFYWTEAWTATLMNTCLLFMVLENFSIWNRHVSTNGGWLHEKHKYYNCFHLLVDRYNESFERIVMAGGQLAVLLQATICLYGTIRFFDRVPITFYMIMPISCVIMTIYITVVFQFSGKVFESSVAVLQAWQLYIIGQSEKFRGTTGGALSLERKYLRSSPILGIRVHFFYFIKLGTTVTYVSILITNTINLLLA